MNRKTNKAFIVELLALVALLIMVITVVSVISIRTRNESLKAKELSDAVLCAQNTAEACAGAEDAGQAAELVGMMEGADEVELSGQQVSFLLTPTSRDTYYVTSVLTPEKGAAGTYVSQAVSVFREDSPEGEPIYTLESGNYIEDREEAP